MNIIKPLSLVGLFFLSQPSFAQYATSWDTSEPSINQISRHVYRWGNRGTTINGLFVPTSEGIIVIDGPGTTPCDPDSAQWFKEELERRYDVPVRYVVLSHDHQTHICGTTVFADTAVSIGPTHRDNLIVTHIPQDGVLFVPDLARPEGQLPNPDFRDMDVDSTIEVLGILARMDDVDIVVPGHNSPVATQAYFRRYREYLANLRERVLTHMVAGRSLEEILGLVTMDDFADYTNLEQNHEPNVTTMYDYLYRYREPTEPGGMPIRAPQ